MTDCMADLENIDVDEKIAQMAEALAALLEQRHIAEPLMLGIYTGGAWVAERLHRLLDLNEPLGMLDISFYRDDFSRVGVNPHVRPSELPTNIDERHVVLVDDVLNTGRTIRAALNELFDYGRPASIMLVTLVERGGRELPIQADVVGLHVDLPAHRHIKLQGPDPLRLVVRETGIKS